jgi:hypothetical protein
MESEHPKVFISYNRTDRDWAEWIAGTIESAGYEPIIQAWHFRPGENFVLRMQEAAAQTDFSIAVLSETYLKSEYTQPEWAAAFAQDPTGKKRKLIPVRVAECALTGMFVPIVHIDLIGLDEPDERATKYVMQSRVSTSSRFQSKCNASSGIGWSSGKTAKSR